MADSISLLLGAGFSAPMGYPIGNKLNELILSCDGTTFGFHQSGVLAVDTITGGRPDFGYKTSYDVEFDYCRALIKYYHENIAKFDYEEFYDFLIEKAEIDKGAEQVAQSFLGTYHTEAREIIAKLKNIYNQIVGYYLKDGEGETWYDDEGYHLKPTFQGYTGVLNCLEHWGKNGIVNVHTLNHDLFFERLAKTDWLKGELSDGFEEMGSSYYGKLNANNRNYMVRLQYFNEDYNKKFRLYKLHGSRDYGIYHGKEGASFIPQVYLKTRYGVGFGNFFKEITTKTGEVKYEDCWVNYHADFLTGTTSKIERYTEPLIFNKLFGYFRSNLQNASQLVITGYGAKDKEINNILLSNFDFKSKPSYIIDPFPSPALIDLQSKLGAKLIVEQLEKVTLKHFA